jgi:hypothetical protein
MVSKSAALINPGEDGPAGVFTDMFFIAVIKFFKQFARLSVPLLIANALLSMFRMQSPI